MHTNQGPYSVLLHNCMMCPEHRAYTVLDTDNLHFSDEFLDFPVQADADIHADALGFSARFRCDFPQDSARKNQWRQEFRADSCGKRNPVGTYCSDHITFFLFIYVLPDCILYFIISCNLAWRYFLYYSIRLIHIRSRDPLYTPHHTQSPLFLCLYTHICAWHRQCKLFSLSTCSTEARS